MKVKKYYCGLYFVNILFIHGANNEEIQAYLNKNYEVDFEFNRSHLGGVWSIGEEENKVYCIWVGCNDVSVLCHEVFHLTMDVFSDRGIVTDDDHQEPFAYYMQYWVDIFRRELTKKKKNKEA